MSVEDSSNLKNTEVEEGKDYETPKDEEPIKCERNTIQEQRVIRPMAKPSWVPHTSCGQPTIEDIQEGLVDYSQWIFWQLLERSEQTVLVNYFDLQDVVDPRTRYFIGDMTVGMSHELGTSSSSMYLALSLLDSYLGTRKILRDQLTPIAAVCLSIACKLLDIITPSLSEFMGMLNVTVTMEYMIILEINVLHALDFDLMRPTSYVFLVRYCERLRLEEDETLMARFISHLALLDGSVMLVYKPHIVAAVSVYLAIKLMDSGRITGKQIRKVSSTDPLTLQSCALKLIDLMKRSGPVRTRMAVYKKFHDKKYLYTAEKAFRLLEQREQRKPSQETI